MASERKTIVTYKGTGSQKVFAFPFDYLRKSFIKVMIDGNHLTYGTDYTVSDKQLTFTNAPVLDAIIVIYRETATDRLVAWEDASVLRAGDLTLFEVQLLHIAEETKDRVQEAGLALDDLDGKWDARLKAMKNLLDPVDKLDAVNKRYFESTQTGYLQASQAKVDQATAQANFAQSKATDASVSASAARTSELNAKASEIAAKTSETNAKTSETNAATSATTATNKATEATNEADRSKSEADRSRGEADRAYGEAERARVLTDGAIIPAPSLPVGVPFPWFPNTFPDGTLECNGQSFNTTTFPELAKVYPSGVLPDLRGVVMKNVACYWLVYAVPAVVYDMTVQGGNALTLGGYPASYFAVKADVQTLTANTTIETYVAPDYSYWYRKYPDGWLEQGGFFVAVASDKRNITLMIPHAVFAGISHFHTHAGNGYVPRARILDASHIALECDVFGVQSNPLTVHYWEVKGRWK